MWRTKQFYDRESKKGKLFEQDDDMTKKEHLKVIEFYGKIKSNNFSWLDYVNAILIWLVCYA